MDWIDETFFKNQYLVKQPGIKILYASQAEEKKARKRTEGNKKESCNKTQ